MKIEKVAEVKKTNKEIRLLINKLKKELPATGMRMSPKDPNTRKGRKRTGNDLKELEQELRMIEGKIGKLSG